MTRAATDRPNFILINCDDLGYGDLGCYGSRINRTPALDRMAAEGMRLTDFYMASPVCSPSRGAMMTGCYPRRIGFYRFSYPQRNSTAWVLFPGSAEGLHEDEITLAHVLGRQGYATRIVGKWHCGDQPEFLPTRRGFDSYYGLPYSNDMGRQAGWDIAFPPLPLLRDEQVIQQQPDQAALTERYVEESVRFLRAHRDEPFFLYLAHMYVHLPLYAPKRFLDTSQNGPYGACVECIDWSVAVLMHELRRLGIDRNTLVVFTSDNGSRADHGASNAPLRGRKGTSWEGGQRVPCLAWWPGVVPAGATCGEVVTAMDFLPTFAGFAGPAAPDDRILDGRDIAPILAGEPGARSPHEAFFYFRNGELQAVRGGRWKLHVRRQGEAVHELYDLQADLAETTDAAAAHPQIVRELEARADACRDDLGDLAVGAAGRNCRPVGKAADPRPLTEYDPQHPYIIAEYDLTDRG
jgi:arylsulfatase A